MSENFVLHLKEVHLFTSSVDLVLKALALVRASCRAITELIPYGSFLTLLAVCRQLDS
jgi:hypothetical protein